MIQMMLGYEGNQQEMNGQRGTEWYYMVASEHRSKWQVGLNGQVGQENGIQHACWDKPSGEFVRMSLKTLKV